MCLGMQDVFASFAYWYFGLIYILAYIPYCCTVSLIYFFFIQMSILWIYVRVTFVRLPWQKLWHWTLHAKCSTKFSHTCHVHRHYWLTAFYTTFTDLDLAWESQGQPKAKPIGFTFFHTFHLIRMKFGVVMKQLKLNILWLFLSKICLNKENKCFSTDCIKKLLYSHAFGCLQMELIQTWHDDRYYCTLHFDTSLTYLELDSRSQVQESKIFCDNYLQVFNRFEWNLIYYWELLVWWTSYSFKLFFQHWMEIALLVWFHKKKPC